MFAAILSIALALLITLAALCMLIGGLIVANNTETKRRQRADASILDTLNKRTADMATLEDLQNAVSNLVTADGVNKQTIASLQSQIVTLTNQNATLTQQNADLTSEVTSLQNTPAPTVSIDDGLVNQINGVSADLNPAK